MKIQLLLAFVCIAHCYQLNAQDAMPSSATPTDFRESNLPTGEYFFGSIRQTGIKSYSASLFKSPSVKLATYSFRDKKLTRKNGLVIGYNGNGDTQFTGHYQRNKLYGEWRSWYDNRLLCDSGRMVNDMPDGEWKVWYADGKLRYVYHFNAAKLAALKDEIRRQPKIKFFEISQQPAATTVKYFDADIILGNAENDRKLFFAGRHLNKKSYDELTLKSRIDQNTGSAAVNEYFPPFAECLLHGSFTAFYPDGRTKETGLYINGLREGMWEEFSEGGNMKAVGTYYHGRRTGEWRYYDALGKLQELKIFNARGREKETFDFSAR